MCTARMTLQRLTMNKQKSLFFIFYGMVLPIMATLLAALFFLNISDFNSRIETARDDYKKADMASLQNLTHNPIFAQYFDNLRYELHNETKLSLDEINSVFSQMLKVDREYGKNIRSISLFSKNYTLIAHQGEDVGQPDGKELTLYLKEAEQRSGIYSIREGDIYINIAKIGGDLNNNGVLDTSEIYGYLIVKHGAHNELISSLKEAIYTRMALLDLLVISVLALTIFIIFRSIVKPIYELSNQANSFLIGSSNNFYLKSDLYEFNLLTQTLNHMLGKIKEEHQQTLKLNNELEESVRARTQELKESETRLQTIITMEPECVKIINEDGSLLYINQAGLNMIEADSFESVIGCHILKVVAPEFRKEYAMLHKRVISGETMQMQYMILGLKGGSRWLETHAVPMQEKGRTVHLSVTRDISERKKAEEQLKIFNSELQKMVQEEVSRRMEAERLHQKEREALIQSEKMAQLGNMLGAIIHQWKQPLNAISIEVQSIKESYKYEELNKAEIERVVSSIMSQVKFMTTTADDFRNFYKPSKEKKYFSIMEQITSVINLLSKQLQTKNITLNIEGEKNICIIGFDSEFKQVILNIIINAKDAFEERKIKNAQLDIKLVKDGQKVVLSICDNAGGISEEFLPDKIFEAFASTKGAKGTGIGLSLSRIIIEENMNGKLEAKNRGDGACFEIEFHTQEHIY